MVEDIAADLEENIATDGSYFAAVSRMKILQNANLGKFPSILGDLGCTQPGGFLQPNREEASRDASTCKGGTSRI